MRAFLISRSSRCTRSLQLSWFAATAWFRPIALKPPSLPGYMSHYKTLFSPFSCCIYCSFIAHFLLLILLFTLIIFLLVFFYIKNCLFVFNCRTTSLVWDDVFLNKFLKSCCFLFSLFRYDMDMDSYIHPGQNWFAFDPRVTVVHQKSAE